MQVEERMEKAVFGSNKEKMWDGQQRCEKKKKEEKKKKKKIKTFIRVLALAGALLHTAYGGVVLDAAFDIAGPDIDPDESLLPGISKARDDPEHIAVRALDRDAAGSAIGKLKLRLRFDLWNITWPINVIVDYRTQNVFGAVEGLVIALQFRLTFSVVS